MSQNTPTDFWNRRPTVGELKAALNTLPDELPVFFADCFSEDPVDIEGVAMRQVSMGTPTAFRSAARWCTGGEGRKVAVIGNFTPALGDGLVRLVKGGAE